MALKTTSRARNLLAAVILCGALAVAQDREPALSNADALTAEELDAVLEEAVQTQMLLERLSAEFRVTYTVDLDQLAQARTKLPAYLTYNDGVANATMKWARDEGAERVEVTFDRPNEFKRQKYEDQIIVDDGQMQIIHIKRTRQTAIISSSGGLSCRTPTDWLLPAFRRTFAELRSDPLVRIKGFRCGAEDVVIRVYNAPSADNAVTVECILSPAFDYAVTNWACPEWGCEVALEYQRDSDGRVIPTRATRRVFGPEPRHEVGQEMLHTQSITLGQPEARLLQFEFKPGMRVADNRPHQAKVYKVNASGEFDEIKSHSLKRQKLSGRSAAIGVLVLVPVIAVLALRARATLMPT